METRDRKPKFREYFREDVEKRLKVSFDSLLPTVRAKEMTRFYVKAIVSRLTPGLVPDDPEEIDDYIVDGPNDGGVDFIYPAEGRAVIVQSKFRGLTNMRTRRTSHTFARLSFGFTTHTTRNRS